MNWDSSYKYIKISKFDSDVLIWESKTSGNTIRVLFSFIMLVLFICLSLFLMGALMRPKVFLISIVPIIMTCFIVLLDILGYLVLYFGVLWIQSKTKDRNRVKNHVADSIFESLMNFKRDSHLWEKPDKFSKIPS